MPLPIGQSLYHNRYRIDALLGQGGMGAVYRAWDMSLNMPMAVKENLDASPEAQKQFEREAGILARLSHPNLPRVTDYFFIPDQGQYLVMDLVEGEDLQAMLNRLGVLPEPQVLNWISQICDALAYLHSQPQPVIHRDIKPANIKIRPDGRAMLVDFGIAKIYAPYLSTMMGAKAVTLGYSPPEQYGGGTTDARSDIYALGATLYHLLTGHMLPESVQRAVGSTTTPPPRQINQQISPMVEQAILKAIEVATDRRFQSVDELRVALTQPVRGAVVQPSMPPPVRPQPVSRSPTMIRPQGSRPFPLIWVAWWLSGVGLIAIILIVSLLVISRAFGGVNPTPTLTATAQSPVAGLTPIAQPIATSTAAPTTPTIKAPSATVVVVTDQRGNSPSPTQPPEVVVVTPTSTLPLTVTTVPFLAAWKQGALTLVAQYAGKRTLFTMNLSSGGEPVLLFTPSNDVSGPAWSPDGTRIAFYTAYPSTLQVVDAITGATPRFLRACIAPSWSPDGRQLICLSREGGQSHFDIVDANSGMLARSISMEPGAVLPDWSPTGAEVAYSVTASDDRTSLWRLSMNEGLPALLAGEARENYAPDWSPDGKWIAYQSTLDSSESEIWVMDRNGQNARRITRTPRGWSRGQAWSPDGQWIAYVSSQAGSIGADFGEVFVVSVVTGQVYQVTHTGGLVYDWRVSWGK